MHALAAAVAAAVIGSLTDDLRTLADLRRSGDLSDAQFEAAKQASLRQAGGDSRQRSGWEGGEGPLNVVRYGADPGGTNDSTAAFRAAIDFAVTKSYKVMNCGGGGCGRTIADLYVPAGRYRISDAIDVRVAPGIHGEGTAIIEQTNSSADIFYGAGVWRTQISGLHFMGGQNHLHFGTNNENTGFITVERCVFTNASSAAIRMIPPHPAVAKGQKPYQGSASTQVTVSKSEFFTCERVVVNHCDAFFFLDNWVNCGDRRHAGGCSETTCQKGVACFENHDGLVRTCIVVLLAGFLASRRRKQLKNGEKSAKNGRDTAT
eukprot:COSAG04_NODE_1218_length_7708_cov_1.979629_9_plen_319_part_00